jgi:hypothetical protein
MLATCAKFAALCALVVLSVQLPFLLKKSGAWGQQVPLIERVDGSNEIARSELLRKDANAEASIPALDAIGGLSEEANEDEKRRWVQRYSLVMKDTVFEVGDRVLEVAPQFFAPVWRLKGGVSAIASKFSVLNVNFNGKLTMLQ